MSPTLVVGLPAQASTEELLGPAVSIHSVGSTDDAIAAANGSQTGLAGFVLGGDLDAAMDTAVRIEAGEIRVNGCNLADLADGSEQTFWNSAGAADVVSTTPACPSDDAMMLTHFPRRRENPVCMQVLLGGIERRGSPTSSGRRELGVQFAQTAQQEGRLVVVRAPHTWAVVGLADAEIGHSIQQTIDGHAAFNASEGCSRTRVNPSAEGDVLPDVLAVQVEFVRLVELPRVTVGGAEAEHHNRACFDRYTTEFRCLPGESEVDLRGALVPEGLFDECGDQRAVGAQSLL